MIGTLEIGSYFWTLIIYTISLLISLIFITVCCVCNPKSKHYFQQKHILSNEFIANNKNDDNVDGGGQIIDRSNHQVTSSPSPHRIITNQDDMVILNSSTTIKQPLSLNRALPDIPQQSIKSNDNNDAQNKQSSSTAAAAAVNSSTVNVEINDKSCSNDNHQHSNIDDKNLDDNHEDHAYARIRNLITTTDSSTDTDNDYSDPNSIVVVQNPPPPLTPNHSRADHELPISPSDRMIRSSENVDEIMLLNNHHNQMIEPKREISYNTISVREPLAKVLAERENHNNLNNLNLEHHYNEVEDVDCMERLSSFYEEINSDNSSATYSKINETLPPSSSTIAQNNHCQPSTSNSEMMVNENSANNLPLYAFVDKKSKKFQNNNDSNTGDATNVFIDNLYTKVMKPKKENHSALQRYSQPPPPPPPLPPPLNKDHQQQQHRNTIIFVDAIPSTSTSSYLSSNEQQQQIMMNDDEKDPGYETVYKEINQNHHNDGHHSNINEIDYGYEAIQNDPAYEIVSSSSTMTTTTGLDNGYEIIKNHNNYYHYHRFNNHDNDDDQIDDQSDPNYEIISNIKSTTSTSTNNTTTVIINTGQSSLSSSIPPLPAQSSSTSTSITNIQIVNNNNRSNNTLSDDDNFVIIEHL